MSPPTGDDAGAHKGTDRRTGLAGSAANVRMRLPVMRCHSRWYILVLSSTFTKLSTALAQVAHDSRSAGCSDDHFSSVYHSSTINSLHSLRHVSRMKFERVLFFPCLITRPEMGY
jgi:hypothetical protein